jgi:hypothetical protein
MNGNKNGGAKARITRPIKVAPTTRAIRVALAVSATMLALSGSGAALAGTCAITALNTVSCNGVFVDTIPGVEFVPVVDMTLVLGDTLPTSVTPALGSVGIDGTWGGNVAIINYAVVTTSGADGLYVNGNVTATVTNHGAIVTDGIANAVTFTDGTNVLELQAGSAITGNVVASSASDTLRLGGSANASFDASQIGAAAQYRTFGVFQKAGSSIWTLTGTNTAVLPWTINAGTLSVTGSLANSPMTVNSGGTLGGTGTVGAVTVNGGGTLGPGLSPGIINTGNLTLNSGSTLTIEINGTTVGTQYDQVTLAGTVSLGGATLNVVLGFTPTAGQIFTIISNDDADPVSGTFAGLNEGAVFAVSGQQFRISYLEGDGNDVTLTALAASPPTISKSFTPPSVPLGDTSTMSFTITNPNTIALTGLSFSDNFPAGLAVANPPAVADTCGFTSGVPAAGATSFTVSGGSVGASASCTFALNVTATSPGDLQNSSSGMSSNEAPTGAGSPTATLSVAAPIAAVPTLSELGLLIAALLLSGFGVWRLRTA